MLSKEVKIVAVHQFNELGSKKVMVNVVAEIPLWLWERLHKYCNVDVNGKPIPELILTNTERLVLIAKNNQAAAEKAFERHVNWEKANETKT